MDDITKWLGRSTGVVLHGVLFKVATSPASKTASGGHESNEMVGLYRDVK